MGPTQTSTGKTSSKEQRTFWWFKMFFRKDDTSTAIPHAPPQEPQPLPLKPEGLARRFSRKVIPGLPRAGTFKRQQSELRQNLEPVTTNSDERRAVSADRRTKSGRDSSTVISSARLSAPELSEPPPTIDSVTDNSIWSRGISREAEVKEEYVKVEKEPSVADTASVRSNDEFDPEQIQAELESKWILNLSMHFRDKSKREKFFVTYAETPTHWRRVTISLDYRNAPEGSLEQELQREVYQREKSARIYEAIRESLPDIQFYDTVTNLKLQTESDRLHVHVVEDLSEIISYPSVKSIRHLSCRRVREDELVFDSHLSGFVYKVKIGGQVFIKKEIPGPDTVDEFLYEINALHQLSGSRSVIQFGGVVLDNKGEHVKGLLISFAEQGALIDVLYDGEGQIPWERRERWARQIVEGLSEIHEAGFVQGDFTLSNIVIDEEDNAKIIDINRRGCPVGWEPPEVAALIESNQRISMYIGVKSDLYQLGMVLYALATQQDEPEKYRPFNLRDLPSEIPEYFYDLCHRCLDANPRCRSDALSLLHLFPPMEAQYTVTAAPRPIVVEARHMDDLPYTSVHKADECDLVSYSDSSYIEKPMDEHNYAMHDTYEEAEYPGRGRSPPASYRDERRPFEIPLPCSRSGSDTVSAKTPVVGELTPVASKLGLREELLAASAAEILEPSEEQGGQNLDSQHQLDPRSSDEQHVNGPTVEDYQEIDSSILLSQQPVEPVLSSHEDVPHEEREKKEVAQASTPDYRFSAELARDDHHIAEFSPSRGERLAEEISSYDAPMSAAQLSSFNLERGRDGSVEREPSASFAARKTAATPNMSGGCPELAFVGTHIEIPNTDFTVPTLGGADFDDLTTDAPQDMIILESTAVG